MRNWLWIAVSLAMSGCGGEGASPPDPATITDAGTDAPPLIDFSSLATTASDELKELGANGAAIVVLHQGRVVFAKGLGTKVGSDAPIQTSTLFRIASITKTFTAMSALRTSLSLDAKVTSMIPEFALAGAPAATAEITLRQLLTHTSGISDGSSDATSSEPKDDGQLGRWLVSDAFRTSYALFNPPGRTFNYTNIGYAVIARMTELASKKTFPEHLRASVLDGLGIKRFYDRPEAIVADGDYTNGIAGGGATIAPDTEFAPVHVGSGAATAWWTSAEELGKLGQALLDPSIAPMLAELVETDQTWVADRYYHLRQGLGLMVYDGVAIDGQYYPQRIVGHEGGARGFASMLYTVPSQKLAFVALGNKSNVYFDKTFAHAMKLAGLPSAAAMPKRGVDPADYPKLIGTYHDTFRGLGDVIVKEVSGKLFVDVPAAKLSDLELRPTHGLEFECDIHADPQDFQSRVTFVLGKEGRAEILKNRYWVATR